MRESGDSLSEITARLRPACTRGRRVCGDDDRDASVECSEEEEDEEEECEMRGSEQTRMRKKERDDEREREGETREEERDRTFLFIAFYSFRVASDAAWICHGGRHYYGKRTYDAPFIISKFIVLSRPINLSSLEIGTARELMRVYARVESCAQYALFAGVSERLAHSEIRSTIYNLQSCLKFIITYNNIY